jgi:hypothetical protein
VPLPLWALVLMLVPASALLLTVFVLPFAQRQWSVVLYTAGVALLGVSLYALLQLLRRANWARFELSEALACDRWRPEALALAIAAFPAYLAAIVLHVTLKSTYPVLFVACVGAAGGLVGAGMLMFVIVCALRRESSMAAPLLPGSFASGGLAGQSPLRAPNLESIPEASAAEAPLMHAFLQDALVSVEDIKSLGEQAAAGNGLCSGAADGMHAARGDEGPGEEGRDEHVHFARLKEL